MILANSCLYIVAIFFKSLLGFVSTVTNMKPLRIKKRTNETGAADTQPPTQTMTSATMSSAAPPFHGGGELVPVPPPLSSSSLLTTPSQDAMRRASSASSSVSATPSNADGGASNVKFASELDNANVEACLEYLTRPHMSWGSAMHHMAHRREVIDNHRASVFARSLAVSSRPASLASTLRSDVDALEVSTTSSSTTASAPAGFPRAASNASRAQTGRLQKGRLGDLSCGVPAPPSLVAVGNGASSALMPLSNTATTPVGGEANPGNNASRTTSSHSTISRGQRAPTKQGRLSRGAALAGPRAARTSAAAAGAATTNAMLGPDLTIGGTQLQRGGTRLFVGSAQSTTTSNRSASRDGTIGCNDAKSKAKGNSRNASSA